MSHLDRFIKYIQNSGQVPLAVANFDEDWEPIGPDVRGDLLRQNLITIKDDGIRLVTPTEEKEPNGRTSNRKEAARAPRGPSPTMAHRPKRQARRVVRQRLRY